MIYRFFTLILHFWLRIHFRRIFKSGFKNIPAKGPTILACNHPNSFLDAVVISVLAKRPVHFLTRSDVFKKKLARWFLGQINMIPIYRLQEGLENLENNKETFRICNEILSRGGMLLIFSEGLCILEKRLRPLKKGTARIAFSAEELYQFKLNLKIIPISLNYTHPASFRTELMLTVGEAFTINDLKDPWQEEPAKAIRLFNERLTKSLEEHLLIIPDKKTEKQAEIMLDLGRNWLKYPLFKTYYQGTDRLKIEQAWIRFLYSQPENQWVERASRFSQASHRVGIPVQACMPKKGPSLFFIILGFIPSLIAIITHLLPFWLSTSITRKAIKSNIFRSSVLFGTGAILSYIWYLVIFILLLFIDWRFAPLVLTLPWLALFGLFWLEGLQQKRGHIQLAIFEKRSAKVYSQWQNERDDLMTLMV